MKTFIWYCMMNWWHRNIMCFVCFYIIHRNLWSFLSCNEHADFIMDMDMKIDTLKGNMFYVASSHVSLSWILLALSCAAHIVLTIYWHKWQNQNIDHKINSFLTLKIRNPNVCLRNHAGSCIFCTFTWLWHHVCQNMEMLNKLLEKWSSIW